MRPILVTGSTDGIGLAAAGLLVAAGRPVIVHGKDPARGAAVAADLRARHPGAVVGSITADLRDPGAIAGMADTIREDHGGLAALVNNAGIYMRTRVLTPEGLESTFAVNALAPYRVARALEPLLSPPGRMVNVASIAHFSTTSIDWKNLQGERRYDGYAAYSLSKLGVVLMTWAMAARGLEAVSLHPGVCATKLLAAGFPGSRGQPAEHGGAHEARLATAETVEPGAYYDQSTRVRASALARDPGVAGRWCRLLQSFG
jgi:NAD(P)-dependent dehydrogenase (short-subunit alcohol dehydrogenase family)